MRASEVRAMLDATGRGESEYRSHGGFEGTIARPSHLSPGHTGERFSARRAHGDATVVVEVNDFLPPGWEEGAGPAINGSVCPPGRPSVFCMKHGRRVPSGHGLPRRLDAATRPPLINGNGDETVLGCTRRCIGRWKPAANPCGGKGFFTPVVNLRVSAVDCRFQAPRGSRHAGAYRNAKEDMVATRYFRVPVPTKEKTAGRAGGFCGKCVGDRNAYLMTIL